MPGRPDPFGFYRTDRFCPGCGAWLLTATPLTRTFTEGLLQGLGITCYCVRCNSRYRAVSRLSYSKVAWAGPLGRWLWWQTVELEATTPAEE